ncbi:MAG: rRNA pseudouridine synthase [Deltaproteobacteria bacterium]|nr:rRNA pseudouridine synthase [Deltaproteobacteria bacterium]
MSEVRLQLILARAGVASRRAAERFIADGRVSVNGVVVRELGAKADPDADRIAVDGRLVAEREPNATIALHKPDAVVTTMDDPGGRECVSAIVSSEPYRLVPVGRLDYHSEGLLLLSNDGALINRLLHPRHHVPKAYAVEVPGEPTDATLEILRNGVALEDGPSRPADVRVLETDGRRTWLEIVVREGRNRLVRRMLDAVGHPARRVVRTRFGSIALGALRPGQYRYLSKRELRDLYALSGLDAGVLQTSAAGSPGSPGVLGVPRRGRGRIPGLETSDPKARRRVRSRGLGPRRGG